MDLGQLLSEDLFRRDLRVLQRQLAEPNTIQGILATVPGLQRSTLGQVHFRGEHKATTFAINGLPLAQTLSLPVNPPLDPDFFETADARTGNYDGSQGGQVGLILNFNTPASRRSFFEVVPRLGDMGQRQLMVKLGGTDGADFSYYLAAKTSATDLGLESLAPNSQATQNHSNRTGFLMRLANKGAEDDLGLTFSYQGADFQIPQTVQNADAGVRQNLRDSNYFALLEWKHRFSQDADLQLSLNFTHAEQRLSNNGVFTPFRPITQDLDSVLSGAGLPVDPERPGSPYLPTSNLQVNQIQPIALYTHRWGPNHRVTAGLSADFIEQSQNAQIFDLGGGGGLPNPSLQALPPTVFSTNVSRSGLLAGAFASYSLPLSENLTLNCGVRFDTFRDGINIDTAQISPLANLTWKPSENQTLRLAYNRIFQPPPLEVDLRSSGSILPQRVSAYELSYENRLSDTLDARVSLVQKDFVDPHSLTRLVLNSDFPLVQPNAASSAASSRYQGLELSLSSRNRTGFNGFLAATFSSNKPLSRKTFNLLEGTEALEQASLFDDTDQRRQIAWGLSHTGENGLTVATDFLYGSGFPNDILGRYQSLGIFPFGVQGTRIPHFQANFSLNYFPLREDNDGLDFGGGLTVLNVFDSRPLLNFNNELSGTRFQLQRRILLNATFRW